MYLYNFSIIVLKLNTCNVNKLIILIYIQIFKKVHTYIVHTVYLKRAFENVLYNVYT